MTKFYVLSLFLFSFFPLFSCTFTAAFQTSSTSVQPGTVVYFTNTTPLATSFQWLLDGAPQSTDQNWENLFLSNGTFLVELIASDGACSDTASVQIMVSAVGSAQAGLPVWPITSSTLGAVQTIDWRTQPPVISILDNTTVVNPGSTGAAFNGCGDLVFYVAHTGSSDPNNLFIYAPDGGELLSNATANGPGMNAVRSGQELQVVRVPQTDNEWYIFYREWSADTGAPANNAGYKPLAIRYSRVRLDDSGLTVILKDQLLTATAGNTFTYNDGMAVSRTAAGDVNAHYLYAARRTVNGNTLSLDRWLINNTGLTFSANSGTVTADYWSLTHQGSFIELSPTEDRIAVGNRNQDNGFQDFFLFDADDFTAASAQAITGNNLVLVADGGPNDLSSLLPTPAPIQTVANNGALPLEFLQNFDRKLSGIEFSPNGQYLYLTGGGFFQGGFSNLSYLAQIDLETSPLQVRLQVQTTPNNSFATTTGAGCQLSSQACLDSWREVSALETGYDGNLYFTKRGSNTLFVIPDPNAPMPQNLEPSDIDLSTPSEPNLFLPGEISNLPDQIDGFNYLEGQVVKVAVVVTGVDCDGICRAPFEVQIRQGNDNDIIETFTVAQCPDTFYFCADTSLAYQIFDPAYNLAIDSAIAGGVVQYEPDSLWFAFHETNCTEFCDNGIDDDNDGLIDCLDPDLFDDCCCAPILDAGPDLSYCEGSDPLAVSLTGFSAYQWSPAAYLSCTTCASVEITPSADVVYVITATTANGCQSQDTLQVAFLDSVLVALSIPVCPGGSVTYNGQALAAGSVTPFVFSTFQDCDSTVVVTVVEDPGQVIQTQESLQICAGDSALIFGDWVSQAGEYSAQFSAVGGCDSLHTIFLSIEQAPVVTLSTQAVSCFGGADGVILFTADDPTLLSSIDGVNFFDNTLTQYGGLEAGTYPVYFQSQSGCVFELEAAITQPPQLTVQLPADQVINLGETAVLEAVVSGQGLVFSWLPTEGLDCGSCQVVAAQPAESTLYTLTVTDPNGCQASDQVMVNINLVRPVYIPNIFSPDYDGINDRFVPYAGIGVSQVLLFQIYDRWGNMLFESRGFQPGDEKMGWDGTANGKPLNAGVYAYLLQIEYEDGQVAQYQGSVHLLR